ncbi:mannose-1-phosphate guanylyltransferase/mannose-6-phosphate isomerase [Legionella brunensis]|uniref:mannose-1-phosphate guanylyltransferase n=1 Tax=Legionella brunensis TaxID=29422 RepID=A0A0W0SLB7_9GAMM|nr:mannose-1-phosphate guanylyltransferase/mannose-6-phosphate isomerase [Legionella brunensis]KTC84108.1 mannose-1-phosphate guanylyltransferase [Legionella brunensis]
MILPIILAGGCGSRLWPLSRKLYPKQFLKLHGSQTMLQATITRLNGLNHQLPMVLCNEEHRFLAAEQLREINLSDSTIILEPEGRGTAPSIALAALLALQANDNPILLVLPADHIIMDINQFQQALKKGLPYAEKGKLVTFGIPPDKPETGYGYINAPQGKNNKEVIEVAGFTEKPDLETAREFLEIGDYYWNSGIFMFTARDYLHELEQHREDIYTSCVSAINGSIKNRDFLYIDKKSFLNCPSESLDYAVMEKTTNAVVVPMEVDWSDIGCWSSLWSISEKDLQGNVHVGEVVNVDTTNTYVHTEDKLVVAVGLKDVVVVNTKDALLIADKISAYKVKQIVEKLTEDERSEAIVHREVYRPWGKFDSLERGKRYQVKHITIKPGEKISTQLHHHRAEHWVLISGSAKVTRGDETFLLTENESTYIPVGTIHSLENPGILPLELIEIQSGSYLGEDDIVRIDDLYGRCSSQKKTSGAE